MPRQLRHYSNKILTLDSPVSTFLPHKPEVGIIPVETHHYVEVIRRDGCAYKRQAGYINWGKLKMGPIFEVIAYRPVLKSRKAA